jgi:hypothetical protein
VNGRGSFAIPPETQGGKTFRLRGQGMPKQDGGRGDLLVRISIAFPERLTDQERAILKRWRVLREQAQHGSGPSLESEDTPPSSPPLLEISAALIDQKSPIVGISGRLALYPQGVCFMSSYDTQFMYIRLNDITRAVKKQFLGGDTDKFTIVTSLGQSHTLACYSVTRRDEFISALREQKKVRILADETI